MCLVHRSRKVVASPAASVDEAASAQEKAGALSLGLPALDLTAPARVEIATFSMG